MRGVTLADITSAADQLLADGERPTIGGVRRILGTGLPGTVNTLLKHYFQSLPARLNLPAPIATAAAQLYEEVQATARQALDKERVEAEAGLSADRETLAQERREFEGERVAVDQRVAEAERERTAEKHAGDLQRLREQAEGNERHLLGRIDEQ